MYDLDIESLLWVLINFVTLFHQIISNVSQAGNLSIVMEKITDKSGFFIFAENSYWKAFSVIIVYLHILEINQ